MSNPRSPAAWPSVSGDGSHHVSGGRPAYSDRFDAVLKFHPPGLAPVARGQAAWHIRPDGSAAYGRRFARTFGFYEGRAAVVSPDGWHHILPDGDDLYAERYDWCGNFQGGRCAVRRADGRYLHLTLAGQPACSATWAYAGDFRDGIGVVQRSDGRSTHIDLAGHVIHDRWFDDLDVYHKGFARARDAAGWTHVDAVGRPIYARRFAAVEPFYNGQARVEDAHGALLVIDEAGATIQVLRPRRPSIGAPVQALSSDLVGYWRTRALAVAVELGVFEALPGTTRAIARACALPEQSARRLLRALCELEAVTGHMERDGIGWRATARGALLRRSHPESMADAAREYGGPLLDGWRSLADALRDPEHHRPDVFRSVAADADRRSGHHRMLRAYARCDYPALLRELDLEGHVIDAGGGSGALAQLIADGFPKAEVTVLDLPQVARLVPRHARVTALGVDLFSPWPVTADAVVFARVLHDWKDDDAARLLRRGVEALRPGGQLLVFDRLLSDAPEAPGGGLCDLHLLAVTGGRERSHADFARLFADAGLSLSVSAPTPDGPRLLVGRAHG